MPKENINVEVEIDCDGQFCRNDCEFLCQDKCLGPSSCHLFHDDLDFTTRFYKYLRCKKCIIAAEEEKYNVRNVDE